jgi:hypothetical protein
MRGLHQPLIAAALLCAAALPGWAASSASSAASEGASASVGSSSTSIETSSNSSSQGEKTAAGEYRIVQVAQSPHQPGKLRLTLAAVDGGKVLHLHVPQETAQAAQLAAGGMVTAREHAYGMQFAAGTLQDKSAPFFLVLHDAWFDELKTRRVTI